MKFRYGIRVVHDPYNFSVYLVVKDGIALHVTTDAEDAEDKAKLCEFNVENPRKLSVPFEHEDTFAAFVRGEICPMGRA